MLASASFASLALAGLGSCQPEARTYGTSTTLWTPCGSVANHTLECATIHVPMDHFSEKFEKKTFSIPLIRLLAHDAEAKTIIFNPGGPGASGVDFVRLSAQALNIVYGEKFHLLGFDPRGTGSSLPSAACQPEDARIPYDGKYPLGPLVPSDDAFTTVQTNSGDYWASQENFAKLCVEVIGEHLGYMNTPQTAADMNDILHSVGQQELLYQGYSYGTALGTTYAQLFPHRVERMALDGVVNYMEYWEKLLPANEVDAEKAWLEFLDHCINEHSTCELADDYKSAEEINAKLIAQLDAMDVDPVGVYINSSAYGILRGSDIRGDGIFARLYSPNRWPYLARSLRYLMQGNYTIPYLHFFGNIVPRSLRTHPGTVSVGDDDYSDALTLITLADKIPANQATRRKRSRKEIMAAYSEPKDFMGHSADGDFGFLAETWLVGRTHNLVPQTSITTDFPVLVLSNVLDPVTPLRSAKATSAILKNSVLLIQDGIGHCTISKASRCTVTHIRKYFELGILPPNELVCEVDDGYFPDPDVQISKAVAEDDLDWAMQELAKHSEKLAERRFRRF